VKAARRSQRKSPMTFEHRVLFWFAVAAVAGVGLWLLSPVLLPSIVGMALAYLLNPVTNQLERLGVSFVDLLLAVPLAAAFGVLVRFALRRYRESPLYARQPE
jgi:predicted PurR-regulated permease PerM